MEKKTYHTPAVFICELEYELFLNDASSDDIDSGGNLAKERMQVQEDYYEDNEVNDIW